MMASSQQRPAAGADAGSVRLEKLDVLIIGAGPTGLLDATAAVIGSQSPQAGSRPCFRRVTA